MTKLVDAGEVDDAVAEEIVARRSCGDVGAEQTDVWLYEQRRASLPVHLQALHLAVTPAIRLSPVQAKKCGVLICWLEVDAWQYAPPCVERPQHQLAIARSKTRL